MLNVVFTDFTGTSSDLYFLQNDKWLRDAAVITNVFAEKGRWRIVLVFAWVKNPMQLICRLLPDSYPTKTKADSFAQFFTRSTQKDKRGLLTIQYYDFTICYN
jgi:hypothetical protein